MNIITITKTVICGSGLLNVHFPVNICLNIFLLREGCRDHVSINTSFMQNPEKVGNSYG